MTDKNIHLITERRKKKIRPRNQGTKFVPKKQIPLWQAGGDAYTNSREKLLSCLQSLTAFKEPLIPQKEKTREQSARTLNPLSEKRNLLN